MSGHTATQADTPRPRDGSFYAAGAKVFRAPIETKTESGTSINVGFPVCTVSEYVSVDDVVECLNASHSHADLVRALEEIAAIKGSADKIACLMTIKYASELATAALATLTARKG